MSKSRYPHLIRTLLLGLAVVPAIYVFVAIQYSAITVPFWDHTELIRWIASWYDGTFTISSLWWPHNQTRPLVYRAVMLFNAILTGWDIRSEYVYMYAAIYGVFVVRLWTLRRLTAGGSGLVFPLSLLLLSLLSFSPVGHNNHWWSMMFQLNIANLLIAFGLHTVFLNPQRWTNHVLGAVSCWLAAYSLTNGVFAFLAVMLTLQIASRSFEPNRWTLFWAANLALLLIVYMPGIPVSPGAVRPSLQQLFWFSLVYLGTPFGSILWFPFKSQFDLPIPTLFHGLCGIAILVSTGILVWHARERLWKHNSAALILVGSALFAVVSAITTAWGRATFDSYGVSNANASRYTIFGVYLVLGQIYYLSAGFAGAWWPVFASDGRRLRWSALGTILATSLFVVLAAISYIRAIPVYSGARDFNRMLARAYPWGLEATPYDRFIHPTWDFVKQLKRDLQRFEIGPYRSLPMDLVRIPVGAYEAALPLSGDAHLTQRFRGTAPGLKTLGVTVVTWNNRQESYQVRWRLYVLHGPTRNLVSQGEFSSIAASDWVPTWLQLPYLRDSEGRTYEIEFFSTERPDANHVIGLPLYSIPDANSALFPAVITGDPDTSGRSLELWFEYAR